MASLFNLRGGGNKIQSEIVREMMSMAASKTFVERVSFLSICNILVIGTARNCLEEKRNDDNSSDTCAEAEELAERKNKQATEMCNLLHARSDM